MAQYRIYFVSTAKTRTGKGQDAVRWWNEKGKALFEATPGTKAVRAYTVQFGLGGEYGLEVWREVEDYAALDRLDEDILANPAKYAPWAESRELFEWGPARLMGDWPQSQFPIGDD